MSDSKQKSNPSVAIMVQDAITVLSERKGSSLQAIKKFVVNKYAVDMSRYARLIRRYLASAVEKGDLIRPKGVGASGSFKLAKNVKPTKKKQSKPKVDSLPIAAIPAVPKEAKAKAPKKTAAPVDEKKTGKGNVAVKKAEPKSKAPVAKKKALPKPKPVEVFKPKPAMEKKVASPKIPKAPKAVKSPKKTPAAKKTAPAKKKAPAKK